MATIRSFTAPFEMTDLTEELLLIPNTYGLVNQLGIFREWKKINRGDENE